MRRLRLFPFLLTAGCEMSWRAPELLWLFWLVPVFLLSTVFVERDRRRRLATFVGTLGERLTRGSSPPRRRTKLGLIALALTAITVALAGPRLGYTEQETERSGVELIVALDVSNSMLAQDGDNSGRLSRLERAKREIHDLLGALKGDRIGIVAFAGEAFVQCPLTHDYGAVELFLRDVDTELISVQGTAIGDALTVALDAFDRGVGESQAVLLITDGEDHSTTLQNALAEAEERGVRLYTLGIGSPEGAPIPSERGGFKKDRGGEVVVSRLDEAFLARIAERTGGAFVRAETGDNDLRAIYFEGVKQAVADKSMGVAPSRRWNERFQWFVALALLLLAVEPLVRERTL